MKRLISCSVAAATIVAVSGVVAVVGIPLGSFGSSAEASNPSVEAQVLALVNADRTTRGLPALAVDPGLVTIARSWSDHLLATGSLSHNLNLQNQITPQATAWGENVGMGPTAQAINTAWLNSPSHYANLVGNYDFVGVGVSTRTDGTQFVTVDYELTPISGPRPALIGPVSTGGVTVAAASAAVPATVCQSTNPANHANPAAAGGYLAMSPDGGIFSYGDAAFLGSLPGRGIHANAVRVAPVPGRSGYWMLGTDGGVFGFGAARYLGSAPGIGHPIDAADIAPTRTGNGYLLLARDGGVFAFGDAQYYGSLPAIHAGTSAVRIVATPSGHGYWILGGDGGVYTFGDAQYYGALPDSHAPEWPVAMASTPTGRGYWILGSAGGVYSFGDAAFHGSVPGIGCTSAIGVAIAPTTTGNGYYVLASDGRVFAFGDAPMRGDPATLGAVSTKDMAVTR